MAITQATLTHDKDTTNTTTYTTASISPGANRLLIARIVGYTGGTLGTVSLGGNGLTWVEINTRTGGGSTPDTRVSLFRAMGASPTSGAITITWSQSMLDCIWSVDEFDGVDTTGTNGSGAIVQSATNQTNGSTNLTVTLAALGDAVNNAVLAGFFSYNGDNASSYGTYSLLSEDVDATDALSAATIYKLPGTTTPSITYPSSQNFAGVAIEIKAGAAGSSFTLSVTKGNLTLTGKTIVLATTMPVTKGTMTLTGRTITFPVTMSVTKGNLTLTGKSISLSTAMTVTKGDLTLTGKSFTFPTVLNVTKGTLTLSGKNITLTATGQDEVVRRRMDMLMASHVRRHRKGRR